jgi:hypothetical protein
MHYSSASSIFFLLLFRGGSVDIILDGPKLAYWVDQQKYPGTPSKILKRARENKTTTINKLSLMNYCGWGTQGLGIQALEGLGGLGIQRRTQ